MNPALIQLEICRAVRNRRTLIFAAVLPVVFFLAFSAGSGGGNRLDGLAVAPYLMVSMAGYGTMNALFTGGGVIAAERSVGWPRQLRIAGLSPRDYIVTKVLVSYFMALPGLIVVFVVGALVKQVHMDATQWLAAGGSVLLSLIPISALGVALGYSARPQSLQPIFGIGSALLALLGGLWVPASTFPAWLRDVVQVLPTYWAGQAGRSAIQHSWVGVHGLVVLAAWAVAFGALAAWLYRRDSLRPSAAGTT
ncbi:MAG: ABC transporter permease [Acidimicrobiales bacterium]